MDVTLPKELEDFVRSKAASGEYTNTSAVVVEALQEMQASADDPPAWSRPLADGSCPPELRDFLLAAVKGPHHPLPSDYFEKVRQRLRASALE
jgi:putative addiction module CopG family antidote